MQRKETTITKKDNNDGKGNVISTDKFLYKQAEKNGHPGIQLLMSMSEQQLDDLFQFLFGVIEWEIKFGLGHADWEPEDDEDEPDLHWFGHIQNVINQCTQHCYFCDDSVDPNETQYGEKEGQWLCGTCQMKLANVLAYHGANKDVIEKLAPLGAMRKR